MAFTRGFSMGALVLAIFMAFASSSSSFMSDEDLNSHGSTCRNLLQVMNTNDCPVNFEFQNYTIITCQCKGPDYPAQQCCAALLQFACPFADEINDSSNYCASIMFSYINIYGKYPPGLFASICEGNKEGHNCPAGPPPNPALTLINQVPLSVVQQPSRATLAFFLLHLCWHI